MGLFLSISGIASADRQAIEDSLQSYAASHKGQFERLEESTEEFPDVMAISESAFGRTAVLYPGSFFDWNDAAQHLSRTLRVPVISLHIHDDDLWMYVLYVNGEEVDHFNPIPDYWIEQISDSEFQQWSGNPATVAKYWPDVAEDKIRRYLVRWDLDAEEAGKAYPDDEFKYNDSWQLVDFMRKLGLDYPLDDQGQPFGDIYRFECEGND